MSQKKEIYTAADFERYYAGLMTVREMHQLERAALEDSFLGDALEGYRHTDSFGSDVAALKITLAERQKRHIVVSIAMITRSAWWRVAALFIIIAGGGYFFIKLNHTDRGTTVADNGRKSIVQTKQGGPGKNDTAATHSIAFANQPLPNVEEKRNTLSDLKPESDKEISNPNSDADSIRFKVVSGKYGHRALSSKPLRPKVSDENSSALTLASSNTPETTFTGTNSRLSVPSEDTNKTATASEADYGKKNEDIPQNRAAVNSVKTDHSKENERMLNGYSQRNRRQDTAAGSQVLSSKSAGLALINQTTPTLPGNEAFDQYLRKNKKPVFDAGNNRLTGEVLLSFTINKKGRPHNIHVVKSSCTACEHEALRLLKNGPDWMDKKLQRETVLINW